MGEVKKHKIAAMTVFCKEHFRVENWLKYYNQYKASLTCHVIINNGAPEDTAFLRNVFTDSVILDCDSTNLLAAYNVGIKYILSNTDVDAVMQITNDVKFAPGAIDIMADLLFSKDNIGVVGPVLFKKDSDIIETFGWNLYGKTAFGRPLYCGVKFDEIDALKSGGDYAETQQVTFIPAGAIIVRREAWEKVGLQDETLYMYQDERDFAIRLKKFGYCEVATLRAFAWHQHENAPGRKGRPLSAQYYSSRNKIYLTRKHFGRLAAFIEFFISYTYTSIVFISHILRLRKRSCPADFATLKGLWHGILGKMNASPPS